MVLTNNVPKNDPIDTANRELKAKSALNHEGKQNTFTIRTAETSQQLTHLNDHVMTIVVADVADKTPVFANAAITKVTITENAKAGAMVFDGAAANIDGNYVSYTITEGGDYIEVDNNGLVTLKTDVDADSLDGLIFTLRADDGFNLASHSILVTIDEAEQAPTADHDAPYTGEELPSDQIMSDEAATSLTQPPILPEAETDYLDTFNFDIGLRITANLETLSTTATAATALDIVDYAHGSSRHTAEIQPTVIFAAAPTGATLPEDADGTINAIKIAEVNANDTESEADVTYTISAPINGFEIDTGGIITYSGNTLDHETASAITLTITAKGSDGSTATQQVHITINDVNDVVPEITSLAIAEVAENTPASDSVYTATGISDVEAIVWSIEGTDADAFTIDAATGVMRFITAPDHEAKDTYTLTLKAMSGVLETTQNITINVTNIDDNPIIFTAAPTDTVLAEDTNGTVDAAFVATVSASDADAGASITYTVTAVDDDGETITGFMIDADGTITYTGGNLTAGTAVLTAVASSSDGAFASQSFDVTITEAHGIVFNPAPTTAVLAENADGSVTPIDVARVRADDQDDGDTIASYAIFSARNIHGDALEGFEVNNNGEITYTGTGLDADNVGVTLAVAATGSDGTSAIQDVDVDLDLATDNVPGIRVLGRYYSRSLGDGADATTTPVTVSKLRVIGHTQATVSYAVDENDNLISGFEISSPTLRGPFSFFDLRYVGDGTGVDSDVSRTITVALQFFNSVGDRVSHEVSIRVRSIYDAPSFVSDESGTLQDGVLYADGEVLYQAEAVETSRGATVTYTLKDGGDAEIFDIDTATGHVTFSTDTATDFSSISSYSFTVLASILLGGRAKVSEQDVELYVSPFDLPETLILGTDGDDTVDGIAGPASQLIQGSNGDDIINSGPGAGDKVIIGGQGDDTINLGTAKETILYRFESTDDGFTATDGSDTVNGFEVGRDVLILADTDGETPIVDLGQFITADDKPAVHVKVAEIDGVMEIITAVLRFATGGADDADDVLVVNFDQTGDLVDFDAVKFGAEDADQQYLLNTDQYEIFADLFGGGNHLLAIDDDALPTDLTIY
jgi:hypothetical protein